MFSSRVILLIVCLISVSESAKILGIFPNTGYSQYILGSTLMKALAERGHEVTVISPFSLKSVPNYRNVITDIPTEDKSLFFLESLDAYSYMIRLYSNVGLTLTEATLKSKQVQELLNSDLEFDLVICEQFLNEAHMGFAHRFRAPLILFSSIGANEWTNHLVANPAPFSYVPITYLGYTSNMNFWQRITNTAMAIVDLFYRNLIIFPRHNELLQQYFPGAPNLKDLMYNVSLILLNSHPAMNAPVPRVPNMIEIGGFHVAPEKLPKDLQEFLDGARDGAIFFSMGSNLKNKDVNKEKLDAILRVFGKLKQKVLWKWEDENLPGKPKNVKIGKWLPQQEILAHPNMHAFVTHGGLISTIETVYNGIPMIGIPIFFDQVMNVETAVSHGYAIRLPLQELTEENFEQSLKEILTNTSYREAAQKRSRILKDQSTKPLDTAIFWVEHVLQHGGATHLRSAALNLSWYQIYLLDVGAFVISILFTSLIILKRLLKFKCQKVLQKSKKD